MLRSTCLGPVSGPASAAGAVAVGGRSARGPRERAELGDVGDRGEDRGAQGGRGFAGDGVAEGRGDGGQLRELGGGGGVGGDQALDGGALVGVDGVERVGAEQGAHVVGGGDGRSRS